MKRGRNTAEAFPDDFWAEDMALPGEEGQQRTLILKAAPPPRKVQLMAHGAREIRCACCNQIRPIAGAEEFEEGWICEDCLPK